MRMSKLDWLLVPFLAAGVVALMGFAYRAVGFLGVGCLGVWIALMVGIVNTDADRAADHGPRHARSAGGGSGGILANRGQRHLPEPDALAWVIHIARVVSAGMIILGFGLFFEFQLER